MAAEGMSLVSRSLRISSQMLESSDSIRVKKRRRSGLRSGSFGLRSGFCVCVFLESLGSICVRSGLRSAEVESLVFQICCDFARVASGFLVCAIWVAIRQSGEFGFLDLLQFCQGGRWISGACLIWVIFFCDLLVVILLGMGLLEVEADARG